MFASQKLAHEFARFCYGTAEHDRIRTREVHVLEHALRRGFRRSVALAANALGTDDDHLARFHIAHVGGVDQVESARFGCENVD